MILKLCLLAATAATVTAAAAAKKLDEKKHMTPPATVQERTPQDSGKALDDPVAGVYDMAYMFI